MRVPFVGMALGVVMKLSTTLKLASVNFCVKHQTWLTRDGQIMFAISGV